MSYIFDKEIGRGGMGCVYLGHDDQTGQKVAIKMMSNKVTCLPEYRQLFQAEVQSLQLMNHPSVVHIMGHSWSDNDGNFFLPMEFVEGITIEQHVKRNGAFPMTGAINLMCKILDAMSYVHKCGCIHRDIKPSNIMIRPDGSICIIDFGIAKDLRSGVAGQTVGKVIGTDGYMSPEQAEGLHIDHRTDIYSLGCVLYYMLTGKTAVAKGNNGHETMLNILNQERLLPSQTTGVSTQLDSIYLRAINRDMTKRYQTCKEFRDDLERTERNPFSLDAKITVGRDKDNDIQYTPDIVSSFHLEIHGFTSPSTGGPNRYTIEITDHSTNGTGIDGRYLKNDTASIPYNGTTALPQVMLAGNPNILLSWPLVMQKLREKGWNPQVGPSGPTPPPPPAPETKREFFPAEDRLSGGFCFLCFMFPVVGWVLWGVWHNQYPNKGSKAAMWAWIGFGVGLVFNILVVAAMAA